jgi:ATP phosphoribosyltransferase
MDGARPDLPDVLLLDAKEAARLLSDAGFAFRLVETRAPRGTAADGRLRVIRVRAGDAPDCVELTVCEI